MNKLNKKELLYVINYLTLKNSRQRSNKKRGGQHAPKNLTFNQIMRINPLSRETYMEFKRDFPRIFARDFDRLPTKKELMEADRQFRNDIVANYGL